MPTSGDRQPLTRRVSGDNLDYHLITVGGIGVNASVAAPSQRLSAVLRHANAARGGGPAGFQTA